MKILVFDTDQHSAPPDFRESYSLQRAFAKLGVESTIIGPEECANQVELKSRIISVDVLFLVENYSHDWLPYEEIKNSKKLKIFWSIDSHVNLDWHVQLCKKLKIDILLNAIEEYLPCYDGIVQEKYWFPNAYPDDKIFPLRIEKIYDIGFCGHILDRDLHMDILKKYNYKIDSKVYGESMVRAINSYKIHFNKNLSNDINFRTFETTGCRTLLMTNYHHNLQRLFDIENEIVVYKNTVELDDKIKYYLGNEAERIRIETNGFMRVKKDHSYFIRATQLIDIINNFGHGQAEPAINLYGLNSKVMKEIYYYKFINAEQYSFKLLVNFFKMSPHPNHYLSFRTMVIFVLKCLFAIKNK